MVKVLDGCLFGPIDTSLVVIVDMCWFGSIIHIEVIKDVANILSDSCCPVDGFDL
jgi:hypothetical protein